MCSENIATTQARHYTPRAFNQNRCRIINREGKRTAKYRTSCPIRDSVIDIKDSVRFEFAYRKAIMRTYTDEELNELVKCPKCVDEPPLRQMKQERGSLRNNMTLRSKDGNFRFRVFIRQSVEFEEDFSIGLDYLPKDEAGSICLLRCNGQHGANMAFPHHLNYHIHRAKAEDVNAGIKTERHIEITSDYAAFLEGLAYFLRLISVEDVDRYFPGLRQKNLFLSEME